MTPANGESVQTRTLSFPSLASPTRGSLCRHLGRALDPRSPASVHIYIFFTSSLYLSPGNLRVLGPQNLPVSGGRGGASSRTWPAVSARSLHYLGMFIVVLAKLILPSGRTAVPSSFTLCDDATSRPRQSSQSWLVDLGVSPPLLSFLSSMHI